MIGKHFYNWYRRQDDQTQTACMTVIRKSIFGLVKSKDKLKQNNQKSVRDRVTAFLPKGWDWTGVKV